MRKFLYIFILFGVFFSCQDKSKKTLTKKPETVIRYAYGFRLNDFFVLEDSIRKDDTFSSILEKHNLNGKKVHEIAHQVKDSFNVTQLRLHKPYTLLFTKDKSRKLHYLIYQPEKNHYFILNFKDSIVQALKKTLPITIKRRAIAGNLNGSLSESLKNEGVAASLSTKLTNIYKWSIDFFKSKKGDEFAVILTERYINDSIYDGVDSLAAVSFEYQGKKIYAFPYRTSKNGKLDYYDEEGKSLKNFFLKAPIKTINITSRFAKKRFHPVQKFFKPHNGTDYAAPQGTTIMTTANGVVELVGYSAGNGNHVKIKHDKTFSTQYLHMSKILVRKGQRIRQGQTIGKVGSTGLATGPHVCYRFWKNGKQIDPLSAKLPRSIPMEMSIKRKYLEHIAPLKKELDSLTKTQNI